MQNASEANTAPSQMGLHGIPSSRQDGTEPPRGRSGSSLAHRWFGDMQYRSPSPSRSTDSEGAAEPAMAEGQLPPDGAFRNYGGPAEGLKGLLLEGRLRAARHGDNAPARTTIGFDERQGEYRFWRNRDTALGAALPDNDQVPACVEALQALHCEAPRSVSFAPDPDRDWAKRLRKN